MSLLIIEKNMAFQKNQYPTLVLDDLVRALKDVPNPIVMNRFITLARNLASDKKICNVIITASDASAGTYLKIRGNLIFFLVLMCRGKAT